MSKKSIGLALGSGGSRGYALIPIIKRLEEEGIEISAVSGSSAGALVGAYYALNKEVDSFFERLKNMDKRDFLKLVDPNNPQRSLFKGKKAKKFLTDSFFGKKTFQDTRIPLYICATDATEKKPAYLTEGKIIDAVMASASIPGILPPYKIGKKVYVDGGVLDPVPTRPLLDRGLDKVIGVNLTGYKEGKRIKEDDNLIPALMNAFYMMMEQMANKEDDPRLFMLNPRFKPDSVNILALYEWEKNHTIGRKEIENKIGDLKEWLES